jgi:hypothetical protein
LNSEILAQEIDTILNAKLEDVKGSLEPINSYLIRLKNLRKDIFQAMDDGLV